MTYEVAVEGKTYKVELTRGEHGWQCKVDGAPVNLDAVLTRRDVISILIDGRAYEIKREQSPTDLHMWVQSTRFKTEVRDPRSLRSRLAAARGGEGPQKVVAPMPGKVVRVIVADGQEIQAGKGVLIIEAMKMQNELKSPKTGKVQRICVQEGANVNAGDVLAIVE